jgi:hypothetical protein
MQLRYLLSIGVLLSGACRFTEISVGGELGEQQVQGDLVGGILGDVFVPIPVEVDVQSAIEAQNLSVIKAVFLDNITLNITDTAKTEMITLTSSTRLICSRRHPADQISRGS